MQTLNRGSYSADTSARLIVAGKTLPISRISRTNLLLKFAAPFPPGEATIVVTVDGKETNYPVYLTDGIRERRVEFTTN